MKTNKLLCAFLVLGAFSTPVMASKGAQNGQPFQELQAEIDANRDLIFVNSGAIEKLSLDIENINTRIDDLDNFVTNLEFTVSVNSEAIASAQARITSAEEQLHNLHADLSALTEQYAKDLDAINLALEEIDAELLHLNDLRRQLAEQLSSQLEVLNSYVTDNALAIDGLVLDLVTVNAKLTGITSSIVDLQNRQDQLESSQTQYAEDLSKLTARVADLESAVSTQPGSGLFTFEGIKTDLPVDSLQGWSECYRNSYGSRNAHPEDMVAACTSDKIMLACSLTGSDTLKVAAYANREEVFKVTGEANNTVHTANGVDWYFSYNYSMGFAPVGEGVIRNSADVQDRTSPSRLSWHTHDYQTGGWRCGSATGLNNRDDWEKVIYQAD